MRPTKVLPALGALVLLLGLAACDPPTPPQYPTQLGTPLDPPADPPFTVDIALLDAAWTCTPDVPTSTWSPVLLVASGTLDATSWRAQWQTMGRWSDASEVCVVVIPASGDVADFTRSSQYVARAITRIAAVAGEDVDVVAHSRGGLDTRWALRWFPSTRDLVDDVVTIGVPNRGSVDNMYLTTSAAPVPIFQQSRADSQFVQALNSGPDMTPGPADFTNIASDDDRDSVGDGLRDTRTEPWKMSGATNLLVQDHCAQVVTRPAVRDHGWVWAAVHDALAHTGPAVATRFAPTAPCTAANVSDPPGTSYATTPTSGSEPPLPDYVPMVPESVPPWSSTALPNLPDSDPGPGTRVLQEDPAALAAAVVCPTGPDARYAPEPVLLVPGGAGIHDLDGDGGPDMWDDLDDRFDDPSGEPVCWLRLPPPATGGPTLDLARGAEFVVHAIRTLAAASGDDVDVIAHSRGGFDTAWALRWWPDVPGLVDDVIVLDSPLRGSRAQMAPPPPGQPTPPLMLTPMGHQSRADSLFVGALLLDDPTPGPATWTTIGTWDTDDGPTDPDPYGGASVGRGAYDQRQFAWRWPGAANLLVQQHCPGRRVTHGGVTRDDWVWAAVADALAHAGPAEPGRFVPDTACGTPTYVMQPRQAPATFTPTTNTEPDLPPYVWDQP